MKGVVTKPIELFAEMELFRLLDQFFDKALYYLAKGYEKFNKTQSLRGMPAPRDQRCLAECDGETPDSRDLGLVWNGLTGCWRQSAAGTSTFVMIIHASRTKSETPAFGEEQTIPSPPHHSFARRIVLAKGN